MAEQCVNEHIGHQLIIRLNARVHNLRSGRLYFHPNGRLSTVAQRATGNEIRIESDGTGNVILNSASPLPYFVSIAIRNGESSLVIANIRVNVADREVRFNDNWSLDSSGLANYRLNQRSERVPLATSGVLHIECNIDAFDSVGEKNFIIVRSCFGYENSPVALHLTSSELLDVLWYSENMILDLEEYYHDLYYSLYNDARRY